MQRSMQGDGKVILIEGVVPEGDDPNPTKLLDLEMLVMNQGGRERTKEEFEGQMTHETYEDEFIHLVGEA